MERAWTDAKLDERFNRIDERFDQVDARFDRLEDSIERGFARIDRRFEQMDTKFGEKFDRMYLTLVAFAGTLIAALIGALGIALS